MIRGAGRHNLGRVLVVVGAAAGWVASALGRGPPPSSVPEDQAAGAAEYGIRFTPGMARAIAGHATREMLVNRYGLDKARTAEATEKIARRLMTAAQANDKQVQELIEYALPEFLEAEARGEAEHEIPREFWIGLGKRAQPFAPVVRQLLGDIRQDVQPLLPPKQQLKMMGDLLAAGAALEVFEKTMEQWSKGDADPRHNPFEKGDEQIKKDADGESEALKRARQQAEEALNAPWRSAWQRYVEQAKKLYALDDAQGATADSILREVLRREDTIAKDESWRRRALRNRLWIRFLPRLRLGWPNPVEEFIHADFTMIREPIDALGNELRDRVDKIPTEDQRRAADARALAALGEGAADKAGK